MSEKKETLKKTYTIEVIEYDNGDTRMNRINDGFSTIELLGILNYVTQEVMMIAAGHLKIDEVTRKAIID